MNQNQNFKILIVATICLYLVTLYFFNGFGVYILYPISLLTTYFHELGHALAAVVTGGKVAYLDVNPDTSGVTLSATTNRFFVASGGYLGSILFGNLLLWLTVKFHDYARIILFILVAVMTLTSIIWFADIVSSFIVLSLATLLYLFGRYLGYYHTLIVVSICVILSVLRDYEIGPSSDQAAIEQMTMIPVVVWRFVWLGIAALLSFTTFKHIFRSH